MFKNIALKFIIIIILLFAFINIHSLNVDKININTTNTIETMDLINTENKSIILLPHIKDASATRLSYPIFKINLDIKS